MNIVTLLDMACSADPERLAVGGTDTALSFGRLGLLVARGAAQIREHSARSLIFAGVNGPAWPVCLYAASAAGVPAVPLNYRLSPDRLRALVSRIESPFVVADSRYVDAFGDMAAAGVTETSDWLGTLAAAQDSGLAATDDGEDPAVILFTSGTTAEPKGVVLRGQHLSSYVIQTVEFGAAGPDEAALISVPPYHVAGVGTILTNTYACRRLVYLADFSACGWLDLVRSQKVTQAMVVPTMLARIVSELGDSNAEVPSLRSIAYGGARMPLQVLRRALELFPGVDFVNSYGLTETSSTIAILGPEDHRSALTSDDPAVAARLVSAGRPVPGMEVEIRREDGSLAPPASRGLIFVRGAQVSGEYLGQERAVDDEGWFCSRDSGYLDADGYLYVVGRADDTIIRGGENIAPEEIELTLREHEDVVDAGVLGLPDAEWGQRIVAAVVSQPGAAPEAAQIKEWVRARLRGSRTPDDVVFVDALPYNPLGKLVRRDLATLVAGAPSEDQEH